MARVPTGNPRGRPKGCKKTGGRVAGKSLDRQARSLVSSELAGSILATFEMLGGTAAMVEWAAENQSIFYTQILARLYPSPQRDDPDIQINQQFNSGMSDFEAARLIAFTLTKGMQEQVDMTPQRACDPHWQSPDTVPDTVPLLPPEPIENPDQTRWASEIHLSDTERRAQRLVEATKAPVYPGSNAEQGLAVRRRRRDELL